MANPVGTGPSKKRRRDVEQAKDDSMPQEKRAGQPSPDGEDDREDIQQRRQARLLRGRVYDYAMGDDGGKARKKRRTDDVTHRAVITAHRDPEEHKEPTEDGSTTMGTTHERAPRAGGGAALSPDDAGDLRHSREQPDAARSTRRLPSMAGVRRPDKHSHPASRTASAKPVESAIAVQGQMRSGNESAPARPPMWRPARVAELEEELNAEKRKNDQLRREKAEVQAALKKAEKAAAAAAVARAQRRRRARPVDGTLAEVCAALRRKVAQREAVLEACSERLVKLEGEKAALQHKLKEEQRQTQMWERKYRKMMHAYRPQTSPAAIGPTPERSPLRSYDRQQPLGMAPQLWPDHMASSEATPEAPSMTPDTSKDSRGALAAPHFAVRRADSAP